MSHIERWITSTASTVQSEACWKFYLCPTRGSKKVDVQKEITAAIPKTYDAIKSASMGGADASYGMKAKKK